jgi:hypothetical protein
MASNPVVIPIQIPNQDALASIQAIQEAVDRLTASMSSLSGGAVSGMPAGGSVAMPSGGGVPSPSAPAGGTSNMRAYTPPPVPASNFTAFTDASGAPVVQDGMITGQDARGNFATTPVGAPATSAGGTSNMDTGLPAGFMKDQRAALKADYNSERAAFSAYRSASGANDKLQASMMADYGYDPATGTFSNFEAGAGLDGSAGAGGTSNIASRAGRFLMARQFIAAGEETADTLMGNARTGRPTRAYDFAQTGGALIGAAVGMPFGPIGMAMSTMIGAGIGKEVQSYFDLKEDTEGAAAGYYDLFRRPDLRQGAYYQMQGQAPDAIRAMDTLGYGLAGGLGERGAYMGSEMFKTVRDRIGGQNAYKEAITQATALGRALSPEESAMLGSTGSFDMWTAVDVASRGGENAVKGYLNAASGSGMSASDVAQYVGSISTLKDNVAHASAVQDVASANTRSVIARGGDAAAIGRSLGDENTAAEQARKVLDNLKGAIQDLNPTTEAGKAAITQYSAAVSALNATIAENVEKIAELKVGEGRDIAATQGAMASRDLHIALATAQTPGATLGGYDETINSLKADMAAAQAGLATIRDPAKRRELERAIASDLASLFDARRQKGTFGAAFRSDVAGAGADLSDIFAARYAMGGASADDMSGVYLRAGASREASANSLSALADRMAAQGYSLPDVLKARNGAAGEESTAMRDRIRAAAPGLSAGQLAGLADIDATTAEQMRFGGSGAAGGSILSGINTLSGYLNGSPDRLNAALATAKDENERRAMRYAAQNEDARTRRDILGLRAAQGSYADSPELGSRYDSARHMIDLMEDDPFMPGNRRAGYTNLINVDQDRLSAIDRQLAAPGLDSAARRELMQSRYGVESEISGARRAVRTGWEGRMLEASFGAPSYAGQYATSYRDALNAGHENELFGANTRVGAAANRAGVSMPASDAARAGDAFAQGASGTLNINLKLEGSTLQAIQMKAGTVRDVTVDPGNATRSARNGL